jgi:Na+-translocating ferredoxin:NAD+ oxidoreductase RnfG subunit
LVRAEIEYDEVKDQVQEVFDFVVNEKMTNESLSVSLAKVKSTNDERYKKVKKELSDKKKIYLFAKVEAKNGHSYCDHLKQKSINELATEKLTRN